VDLGRKIEHCLFALVFFILVQTITRVLESSTDIESGRYEITLKRTDSCRRKYT